MKKGIALFIAFLMIFSLFACSNQGTKSSPAASSTAPSAAASPSKAPSPSPSPSAAPSQAASPSASAAASPSKAASPSAPSDPSVKANAVGFFDDGVKPASRKTYNIVWAYPRPNSTMQNIADALKKLETKFNFKSTSYCANNDMDAYLQNIQIFIDQKTDGFIMTFDPTTRMRFKEILDEAKKPVIGILNSIRDDKGSEIVPCAGIEGISSGAAILQWEYDNYKKYWGDVDKSKIGLLDFNYSVNKDFNDRFEACKAQFLKVLPDNAKLFFPADGVAGKLDEQTGYDLASATFAAHPEVKYWFVTACFEQYSAGAARAAEALKIDKNTLITCVGSDALVIQWDNNYSGAWVACVAVDAYQYLIPPLCGLISIMDGKSTMETLWIDKRAPGDKTTFYAIPPQMVTKDTYKAFFTQVQKDAGLA